MDIEKLQTAIDHRMMAHVDLMADLAEAIGIDPKDKTTWPQTWLDEITVIDAARRWLNLMVAAKDHQHKKSATFYARPEGGVGIKPPEDDETS